MPDRRGPQHALADLALLKVGVARNLSFTNRGSARGASDRLDIKGGTLQQDQTSAQTRGSLRCDRS